jgi:PAS domain S-box-containing protein
MGKPAHWRGAKGRPFSQELELLQAILGSLTDPFFVCDRNQVCLFANRGALDFFGKADHELVGKPIEEWLGNGSQNLDRWKQSLWRVLETGRPLMFDDLMRGQELGPGLSAILLPVRDGKEHVFAVTCSWGDHSWQLPSLGALRKGQEANEVEAEEWRSEQTQTALDGQLEQERARCQQAQEALRKSEEYYRRFLDYAPVAIAIYNENKFLFSNRAHSKLMGASDPSELIGRNVLDVIDGSYHDLFRERHRAILEEGVDVPLAAYKCRRLDGTTIDVETIAIPFIYRGKQASMGIALDVTEKKCAEAEVKSQREQLIRADKLASLGIVASGVAHEISNPNNFIMLNASVLGQIWRDLIPILDSVCRDKGDFRIGKMDYSQLREKIPALCSGILDGAGRIRQIVKGLKDYARPDETMISDLVDLNEVVNAAIQLLANLIRKSTKRFSFQQGSPITPIRGNFQRLEQVMVNLIVNACQALRNKEKGVKVAINYDQESNRVFVVIRDQGVGIPAENLPRIMDPFFTTKRDFGGTGLGLSISSRIVADHGGTLDYTSTPGVGTVATVTFPVPDPRSKDRV